MELLKRKALKDASVLVGRVIVTIAGFDSNVCYSLTNYGVDGGTYLVRICS